MPSSWNVYYVVFLSALLALALPITYKILSFIVPARKVSKAENESKTSAPSEELNPCSLGQRMNVRFFSGAHSALVLVASALLLIPCVAMIQPSVVEYARVRSLIAILSITSFSALGLLYSARKGDLNWLNSFQASSLKSPKKAEGDDET